LRGRVQTQTTDFLIVVPVAEHRFLVRAISLSEPFPRGPFVVLTKNVVVNVFEKLELDLFTESLGGLEPVEDRAARSAGEMLVKETCRTSQHP
jgi:hypothetical protein